MTGNSNTPFVPAPSEPAAPPTPAPARRGKAGRRTKYTADRVRKICRGIADGLPMQYAAARAGIAAETFHSWRRQFPDFDQAVQEAIAKGINKRLAQIQAAGDAGDWKAAAWWLEHVVPEHFARSRIELEAIGQLEHSFVIPTKVLDEIAEARRVHEVNDNGQTGT